MDSLSFQESLQPISMKSKVTKGGPKDFVKGPRWSKVILENRMIHIFRISKVLNFLIF